MVNACLTDLNFSVEGLFSGRIQSLKDLDTNVLFSLIVVSKVADTKLTISELLDNVIVLYGLAVALVLVFNHLYISIKF